MRSLAPLRPGREGFTLIEVLVALTIIAVALIAALRGAMALTANATETRMRLLATSVAENRILELHLAASAPAPGEVRADCPQADVVFTCVQSVQPTPNPFFRRVEIRVLDGRDPSGHEFVRLMALLRTGS